MSAQCPARNGFCVAVGEGVKVTVGVKVGVQVGVGVRVAVAVAVGVAEGVIVAVGVLVYVAVAVAWPVAVGGGVGPSMTISPLCVKIGVIGEAFGCESSASTICSCAVPPSTPANVNLCNIPVPFGPGGVLPRELQLTVTEIGPSLAPEQNVERPVLPRNDPGELEM
jgi:hypothetical protein